VNILQNIIHGYILQYCRIRDIPLHSTISENPDLQCTRLKSKILSRQKHVIFGEEPVSPPGAISRLSTICTQTVAFFSPKTVSNRQHASICISHLVFLISIDSLLLTAHCHELAYRHTGIPFTDISPSCAAVLDRSPETIYTG
jgi:hypothetical protein